MAVKIRNLSKDLVTRRTKTFKAYKIVNARRYSPFIVTRQGILDYDAGSQWPSPIKYEDGKEYIPHRFNEDVSELCGAGISLFPSMIQADKVKHLLDSTDSDRNLILLVEIPPDAEVCIPTRSLERKDDIEHGKFRVSKVKVIKKVIE